MWLGGNPRHWHTAREFNLQQDLLATHILLDSGVPLVHVPCLTGVSLDVRLGNLGVPTR